MAEWNPTYPVMQACICLWGKTPVSGGGERAQEGDIIDVFPPRDRMGMKEMKWLLHLRLYGLEEAEMLALKDMLFDPVVDPILADRYDKRRYQIPLARIKEMYPDFDLTRARDLDDIYQPFMELDADTGAILHGMRPLEVSGLVYDKFTGGYL